MGLLYEVAMEQKRRFLIEELTKLKTFKSVDGKSIHDADYEILKETLVLASFRIINVESSENKWF